jgi:hypothetical protein
MDSNRSPELGYCCKPKGLEDHSKVGSVVGRVLSLIRGRKGAYEKLHHLMFTSTLWKLLIPDIIFDINTKRILRYLLSPFLVLNDSSTRHASMKSWL